MTFLLAWSQQDRHSNNLSSTLPVFIARDICAILMVSARLYEIYADIPKRDRYDKSGYQLAEACCKCLDTPVFSVCADCNSAYCLRHATNMVWYYCIECRESICRWSPLGMKHRCVTCNSGPFCQKCYILTVKSCNWCLKSACKYCSCMCSCGAVSCRDDSHQCTNCDRFMCRACLEYSIKCSACGWGSCVVCRKAQCIDCKKYYCSKCKVSIPNKCHLCDKIWCRGCSVNHTPCDDCEKSMCPECTETRATFCSCGRTFCFNCGVANLVRVSLVNSDKSTFACEDCYITFDKSQFRCANAACQGQCDVFHTNLCGCYEEYSVQDHTCSYCMAPLCDECCSVGQSPYKCFACAAGHDDIHMKQQTLGRWLKSGSRPYIPPPTKRRRLS
jgi:hypothetical protein